MLYLEEILVGYATHLNYSQHLISMYIYGFDTLHICNVYSFITAHDNDLKSKHCSYY